MSNVMATSVDDDYIPVKKWEYEDLVRDSEKVRCIASIAQNENVLLDRETILAICGHTFEKENNEEGKIDGVFI